jgi:hypothetical protein
MLDVLFLSLKTSPVAWTSFMEAFLQVFLSRKKPKISAVFFRFLVIKTLDPYPDPESNAGSGSESTTQFF